MIGLEIHGYISTKEKLFCDCRAEHGMKFFKPNINICPICTSQPGSKPMLPNSEAVKRIIQIALILGCNVNEKLIWQRKHYDWPDLPKGYQNTISGTYAIPVGINGKFEGIKIREVHLEEDPAAWNPQTGEIDYNRSGIPLVEIVTEPDFKTSEEVIRWMKKLILTLSYIKTIDKNAGVKADVNVSIPEHKAERAEIKNINSLTNIKNAIDYEIDRQRREPQKTRETRMYDEKKGITQRMRSKEQAEDYRFISEPDLPVLEIEKARIEKIKKELPETPKEKLEKLIKKYKMDKNSAEILTKNIEIVELFEKVIEKINPNFALPWITVELLGVLNYKKKTIDDSDIDIKSEHIIELLKLVQDKKITPLKAKEIIRKFVPESYSPLKEAKGNEKIEDNNELEKIILNVIKENPKSIEDYKAGKNEALNFLIGRIMEKTNKRADYKKSRELLLKLMF